MANIIDFFKEKKRKKIIEKENNAEREAFLLDFRNYVLPTSLKNTTKIVLPLKKFIRDGEVNFSTENEPYSLIMYIGHGDNSAFCFIRKPSDGKKIFGKFVRFTQIKVFVEHRTICMGIDGVMLYY